MRYSQEESTLVDLPSRAIAQTLNTNYHVQPYSLGNANTTYPISAFITHLVYLRGTTIRVDVDDITVGPTTLSYCDCNIYIWPDSRLA
jgi:hypothetical protein